MKCNGNPAKAEPIENPAKGPENTNWESSIVNEERGRRAPEHEHDVEPAHPRVEKEEPLKDSSQETGNARKKDHVGKKDVGRIKGFPA